MHMRYRPIMRVMALVVALVLALPTSAARADNILYEVTATKVNVRSTPSTNAEILARAEKGEELIYISAVEGWLKVKYGNVTGYVSADYVIRSSSSQSSTATGKPGTVTASRLNLRKSASDDAKILAVLPQGASLSVLEDFGEWLRVNADGVEGYVAAAYVNVSADGASAPVGGTLMIGDTGDGVLKLKNNLIALGYMSGTPSNVFDEPTAMAVRNFQLAHGMTADGVAGASTQTAISIALGDATTETKMLREDDEGADVQLLQMNLIATGYLGGEADGKFGSTTRDAVKAFQRANGLDADGIAGPQTLAALTLAARNASNETNGGQSAGDSIIVVKYADKGETVTTLQNALVKLGYLNSGEADGLFGSKTEAALKKFQEANGLSADGVAAKATWTAINSALGALVVAPSAPSTGGAIEAAEITDLLKEGDENGQVTTLQTRLKELGYFTGAVGGSFGALTKAAVEEFQKAAGLDVDGMVGEKTRAKLMAADAPTKITIVVSQGATLRYGDTGEAVRQLQERLITLKYLTGAADGEYGIKTQRAVAAFQATASITADGVAGPSTISALNSVSAPESSSAATSSALALQIIATAKQYIGYPYVFGTAGPNTFDCSGFTRFVFAKFGYSLPHSAYMVGYNNNYQKLSRAELTMGDLVFFNTMTDSDLCDHVGIYISDGNFIHAGSAGKVAINSLDSGYYNRVFSWGRRIL